MAMRYHISVRRLIEWEIGLVGLMSGIGALIGVFLLLPLPTTFEKMGYSLGRGIQMAFFTTGGLALTFGVLFWFTAANSKSHGANQAQSPPTESFLMRIWMGIRAARDPRIAAAYAAGFAARGNTVVITLFLPLWVNKFFIENQLCAIAGLDPTDQNAIKNNCRAAFTLSSILSGVTQTFALVWFYAPWSCIPLVSYTTVDAHSLDFCQLC
jgi:hypothetical protein